MNLNGVVRCLLLSSAMIRVKQYTKYLNATQGTTKRKRKIRQLESKLRIPVKHLEVCSPTYHLRYQCQKTGSLTVKFVHIRKIFTVLLECVWYILKRSQRIISSMLLTQIQALIPLLLSQQKCTPRRTIEVLMVVCISVRVLI